MKLRSIFNKNKDESSSNSSNSLVLGIEDKLPLNNSNDVIVVGMLKGKVSVNDAVYISNIADDNDTILLTTIVGIEVNKKRVNSASDGPVALCLHNCNTHNIKCGSTVTSRDATVYQVHEAYIKALALHYIERKDMQLTSEELDKLSIADCCELWSLYAKKLTLSGISNDESRSKIDLLAKALCNKILQAPSIFCVYSKTTGEPYLKSSTYMQDSNYVCSPPDIIIAPIAYKETAARFFNNDLYIKEIKNGEDQKGIYNFLGNTFYTNGACGIEFLNDNIAINNTMIVPQLDYSDKNPIKIPITNPDVVRWLLLMGQLQELDSEDKKLVYGLYVGHMNKALLDAKFLVPMKHSSNEVPDENNKITFKENTTISLSLNEGKNGRQAVNIYTDWERLYEGVGKDWSGLIQNISELIETFDCVINYTKHISTACYISKETYEAIEENHDKYKS